MRELLEEEEKNAAAAATISQKKKQAKKTCKERRQKKSSEEAGAAGAASMSGAAAGTAVTRVTHQSRTKMSAEQGASALKTVPWAAEAKEAGAGAVGVGVAATSRRASLQADVEEATKGVDKLGGGGEGDEETDKGMDACSITGECAEMFKSMNTECVVCMDTPKVRLQVAVLYTRTLR